MKALSIRPPWPGLIVTGEKPVENRQWPTKYRGPCAIHASKTWDAAGAQYLREHMGIHVPPRDHHTFGALIGIADLRDCVQGHPSRFFFGPFGFVFQEPAAFDRPVPWRGEQGLFDVPDSVIHRALQGHAQETARKDRAFYILELRSEECTCGRPKRPGFAFCYECFQSLSPTTRRSLYQKIGAGYEDAFDAAVQELEQNGRT
jgi:hypothetical protein